MIVLKTKTKGRFEHKTRQPRDATHHHLKFNVWNLPFFRESDGLPSFRRNSLMVLDDLFGMSAIIDKFYDGLRGFSFVSI
jgi:hypothetical protein